MSDEVVGKPNCSDSFLLAERMEPFSLILGVVAAFKDIYFVSRFVYRTACSARHYREEQRELLIEFRHEFLYLITFWRVIVPDAGKVASEDQLSQVSLWGPRTEDTY